MKSVLAFIILALGPLQLAVADHIKTFPKRDLARVFEIFAWRYTDALNVSQEDEEALKTVLLEHMKAKHDLLRQKEELIHAQKFHQKLSDKDATQKLAQYELIVQQLNEHDAKEMEAIKKILSPSDVLRYLTLKRELTELLLKY